MTRRSQRLVSGSASAFAITAVLTACSQPASYATVDLSGSYGGQPVNAYSALTGEPVYNTATALYGPQSFPDYVPNSQLAYVDAPTNQVASLDYSGGQFDTYGAIPTYQPEAQYSTPVLTEAPLLSTPQFQPEIAEAQPLAQYQSVGSLDAQIQSPAETYAPVESVETVYSAPIFEDAYAAAPAPVAAPEADPWAAAPSAPVGGIESAPLPEITSAPLPELPALPQNEMTADPMSLTVGDDYVTWDQPPATAAPGPAPAPAYRPDTAFTREATDLLPPRPQETRLPAPSAVPPRALENVGTAPKASGAYPRPYELLRPGIYPEIGAGEGLVEAPSVSPMPRVAFVKTDGQSADAQPLDRAASREGEYMIRFGDTLTKIADRAGVTLDTLLAENDLESDSTIYAGQRIAIPGDLVRTAAAVEHAPSEFMAEELPAITIAEIRAALAERDPIQRASIPERAGTAAAKPRFNWPVHGEVYDLGAGQVEIDPTGNAPVSASAAGEVVDVEQGPLGVLVVIEHANGWRSLTVGLRDAQVRVGDTVTEGTRIGTATTEHRVRFELRDAQNGVADALAQLRG